MIVTNSSFAVFILTHGRPNKVITYNSLRKAGYTGKIYLIIDDEDQTAHEYIQTFGEQNVIQFNKKAIAKTFDTADTETDRRTIVYARNAAFEIANDLGLTHFIQLDDDYNGFRFRSYNAETDSFGSISIKSLDQVLSKMIKLLDITNAKSIAMSQGGDWLGGLDSNAARNPLMRKCMNSFIFRTDNPIKFLGRVNEDVNTYTVLGSRGNLFFTTSSVQLDQTPTQHQAGGMTETYLDNGTYMKSFYTVMMAPSCTTVRMMGQTNLRLHHRIRWDHAVPKIISDKHRKQR